jgi:hypothetical protein
MATIAQLEEGLIKAHKAGNMDAARKLAAFLVEARKDPANQIPGNNVPGPAAPPPSIGERAVGAGEALLTTATGATTGMLGMALGGARGVVQDIAGIATQGTDYQRQGPGPAELGMAGAQAMTYAPRTEAGQEYAQNIGEAAQNLAPLAGMAPQVAAIGQGARAGAASASPVARAMAQNVAPAAQRTQQAVSSAVTQAAERLGARAAQPSATPGAPDVAPPVAAPAVAPVDLAKTARTAGEGGMGSKQAQRVLAQESSPSPDVVKSAERLGIREYLQPDHVTTSEAFRQITAAIKSNPQSKLALAEREGLSKVAQRSAQLIDELGGTDDMSVLSAEVKDGVRRQASRMESQSEMLHEKVRKLIPEAAKVDAADTVGFLRAEAGRMGGAAKLAEVSPVEARLLAKLSGDEPITYAYLDATRKQIGQALSKASGPFKDSESGLLKKLYATLSDDQERIARRFGDDAFYNWQAAKYATQLQKGFEDDLVALFGRDLDRSLASGGAVGVPGAMRALASGDSARLGRLLGAIPEEMRPRVVASGLSTVFRSAATRGEFDFTGYMKWYDGLRKNRQSYAAVMSNLTLSQRKQLAALHRVSTGVSESLNRRIKTGALATIKQEMMGTDSLMENLYSLAKRGAISVPAEAATTAMGLPGAGLTAGVTSALMKSKPKVLQAVDDLARTPSGTPQRKAAVRRLATSKAFERLARAARDKLPSTLPERETWITEALTAYGTQQGQQPSQQRTLH